MHRQQNVRLVFYFLLSCSKWAWRPLPPSSRLIYIPKAMWENKGVQAIVEFLLVFILKMLSFSILDLTIGGNATQTKCFRVNSIPFSCFSVENKPRDTAQLKSFSCITYPHRAAPGHRRHRKRLNCLGVELSVWAEDRKLWTRRTLKSEKRREATDKATLWISTRARCG